MTTKNMWCWKHNAKRGALVVLLVGVIGMAVGCEGGARPAVESVPEFEGEILLAEEQPASGGAMQVTVEIAPPDDILAPEGQTGEASIPKEAADIHFEVQVRYTGVVLGGRNEGDFVPFLNVRLILTNRDTGETINTMLVPHVGIAEGYHYARNLALVETIGASEAGYDAEVTIRRPSEYGAAGMSPISPGLIKHSDISSPSDLTGTLLGPDPVVVSGGFILGDFKNIVPYEDVPSTPTASPAEEPAGGGYAY